VWGSPSWAVHRADLNAALRSGLADGQLVVGLGVVDVRTDGDRVEVTFSDDSSRHYDMVVGADGVRSIVRAAVVGPALAQFGGACFWRTTLPEQIVSQASGFIRDALTVGLIPLAENRTHAFLQMRVEEPPTDPVSGRANRVRTTYSGIAATVDRALALLPASEDIHFGVLEWVEPPTWGTGRVVLIGDAAHSMAPPLGLGGAMAIEDAVVLAQELASADDLTRAIPRFIARRTPRVAFVQERTRITWARGRGESVPDEPTDTMEFSRRNYLPLLEEP
jgi:2-polyprenyl-6-methoxyphenol hydroxylase-like FAD-dependent oxidoreductase